MRPASSHSRSVKVPFKDSLRSYLELRLLHLRAGLQSYTLVAELLQLAGFEMWLRRQPYYVYVEICAACGVISSEVAAKIGRGSSRQWPW